MKQLLLIIGFMCSLVVMGQPDLNFSFDPNQPPNTYRSPQNPYYWKKNKPKADYWQQDVHYSIQARLYEERNTIEGNQTLTYHNNSRDTLRRLYFRCYPNAFSPNTERHRLLEKQGFRQTYNDRAAEGLAMEIEEVLVVERGRKIKPTIYQEEDLLIVELSTPIAPGKFALLEIYFNTYFDNGSQPDCATQVYNQYGSKVFQGFDWFPKVCRYSRAYGWQRSPYEGEQTEGDLGAFDVELTLPNDYLCGANSFLLNEGRILPSFLKKELQLKNFADTTGNLTPTPIIEKKSDRIKIWKYHSENQSDFAFVASPIFRIAEYKINGTAVQFLVQEPHAQQWYEMKDSMLKFWGDMELLLGKSIQNKLIIADLPQARAHQGLLSVNGDWESIRQDWFYLVLQYRLNCMVQNSTALQPLQSDGLSHFLSLRFIELKGMDDTLTRSPIVYRYDAKFLQKATKRNREAFLPWLENQNSQKGKKFIGNKKPIYADAAVFYYQLEYLIGLDAILKAVGNYTRKWRFEQPTQDDFLKEINKAAGKDLSWFFDQWFDQRNKPDYVVEFVRPKTDTTGQYLIGISQKGMKMPIDLVVTTVDSQQYRLHLPLENFTKKTDKTTTILPAWPKYVAPDHIYTTAISLPKEVVQVAIATDDLLADVNLFNNYWKPKTKVSLERGLIDYPLTDTYEISWRPAISYNGYDGIKLGTVWKGHHLHRYHRFQAKAWLATRLPTIDPYGNGYDKNLLWKQDWLSVELDYQTPIRNNWQNTDLFGQIRWIEGLRSFEAGIEKRLGSGSKLRFYGKTMYRHDASDRQYLIHPQQWNLGKWNNALHLEWRLRRINKNRRHQMTAALVSDALFSSYDFNALSIEDIFEWKQPKSMLRIRGFIQIGTGNNLPPESALYLAGANPEKMMDHPISRSYGIVPQSWGGYGPETTHIHFGGGLNLRGFVGYQALEYDAQGIPRLFYSGSSGAAINVEWEFDKLLGFQNWSFMNKHGIEWHTYLFADMGVIGYAKDNNWSVSKPKADSGLGVSLTLNKMCMFDTFKPFTVRADFPLLLSEKPIAGQSWPMWVLGLERAF